MYFEYLLQNERGQGRVLVKAPNENHARWILMGLLRENTFIVGEGKEVNPAI